MTSSTFVSWLEGPALQHLMMVAGASSFLCACAWLLCFFLRRRSAAARFAVWQLAACGVLLSTLLIVSTEGIPLGLLRADTRVSQPVPSVSILESEWIHDETPSNLSSGVVSQQPTPISRRPAPSARWAPSINEIAVALWLATSLIVLAGMAISAVRARKVLGATNLVVSQRILDAFEAAKRQTGFPVDRRIDIVQTKGRSIPFTLGLFRPTIAIPAEADDWSPNKLEMVLAHELAHVLRRDYLCQWLSRLACGVAGFNPLTWLVHRRCMLEREMACDDRVIAAGYSAADYGQCLLEFAAGERRRAWAPASGLSIAQPPFRRRLNSILAAAVDRRPLSRRAAWLLLFLFVMLAVSAGALRPFQHRLLAQTNTSELSKIAKAYREQARELESLYVEYQVSTEPLGTRSDIRKYLGTLILTNERKAFAFKGDKRYSKMKASNGGVYDDLLEKMPDGSPKKIPTTPDAEYAFDGALYYSINNTTGPGKGLAAIDPAAPGVDKLDNFDQEYLQSVLRMAPAGLKAETDRSTTWRLADIIDSGDCRVRPDLENVDGAPCVVVEWKRQVQIYEGDKKWRSEWRNNAVWCDPQLGYAARKREVTFASAGNPLERRYAFSDFIEIVEGVWLPRKTFFDEFAPEESPTQLRKNPLLRSTFQVTDIHANDVPDDLFAISFPPEAVVSDGRYLKNGTPVNYAMSDGPPNAGLASWWKTLAVLFNIAVVIIVASIVAYRIRARRGARN